MPSATRRHPLIAVLLIALTASAALLLVASRAAAGPPPGFELRTVVSGLTQPTSFAQAPDGRMFIAEDPGIVRVWDRGTLSVFADLRSQVNAYSDRGLLGIALDPAFASNRWVYLVHTVESAPSTPDRLVPTTNRLIRIRAASELTRNVADPLSQQTILGDLPQEGPWHAIGTVAFDEDGDVLMGMGDGTCNHPNYISTCRLGTLDLDSGRGKILRFDPETGAGSPANPYYDPAQPTAMRSKVLARGLRNPFRFTIDDVTGRIHIGDVGENAWEEFNVIEPAWTQPDRDLNFGWPCYEGANGVAAKQPGFAASTATGPLCAQVYSSAEGGTGPGTRAPAYAYNHDEPGVTTGSAAVAGPTYRGSTYPASYRGRVFLADYARDRFQTMTQDGTVEPFGTPGGFGNPVDIKVGPNGNVRYASIATGTIREIAYIGQNRSPSAQASASPASGPAPLSVSFSSTGSADPDGDGLSYSWDFGDGTPASTEAAPTHVYAEHGTYVATLTVSDGNGGTAQATAQVDVGNTRPRIAVTRPVTTDTYVVGTTLPVRITATDAEDGVLSGPAVTWSVTTHHGGHTHPGDIHEGVEGSYTAPDHSDDSYLEFVATARDSDGATATTRVDVRPTKVRNVASASVTGTTLVLDGTPVTTPYAWDSIPGSAHQVTAPATSPAGTAFQSWTAGGAVVSTGATHDFFTPASGISLLAGYAAPTATAYNEAAGRVTMEAERADTRLARTKTFGTTGPSGAVGQSLTALPDSGSTWATLSSAVTQAPELRFRVRFASAGTFRVWVRAFGPASASDSVHVGVNGTLNANADQVTATPNGAWRWAGGSAGGPSPATISVPSAGVHTVSVWTREDGVAIDRIHLARPGSGSAPTGNGPAESSRS